MAERAEVAALQNDIVETETLFSENIVNFVNDGVYTLGDPDGFCSRAFGPETLAQVEDYALQGLPHGASAAGPDEVYLTTNPYFTNTVLKYHPVPLARQQVYVQANSVALENVEVLATLIGKRDELAKKLGYASYADKVLGDKMAGNVNMGGANRRVAPVAGVGGEGGQGRGRGSDDDGGAASEDINSLASKRAPKTPAVKKFLQMVKRQNSNKFRKEMGLLKNLKEQVEGTDDKLEAWDLQYYMNIYKQQVAQAAGENAENNGVDISHYLEVSDVMTGLGVITSEVFGCEMVEESIAPGEGWKVEGEGGGEGEGEAAVPSSAPLDNLGVRKFKLVNSSTAEELGTIYFDLYPRGDKYTHAAHFTVRCGCKVLSPSGAVADQLPIVALVTNFTPPSADSPSLLSHSEVETLFHEFGHALHSLMSRTKFQHLSGTRGAVDFVETPSHLLEYFCFDYDTVSKFAKHHKTRERIPRESIANLKLTKDLFSGIDKQMQCMYAEFDQAIFGVEGTAVDPGKVIEELHGEYGLPYAEGTAWHVKFGHLVTYGGTYYGYLWAQAIAADIVEAMEAEEGGLLNKGAGRRMKMLLTPGASIDPFDIVKSSLGREWRPDKMA